MIPAIPSEGEHGSKSKAWGKKLNTLISVAGSNIGLF